jgi:hypothetical protein
MFRPAVRGKAVEASVDRLPFVPEPAGNVFAGLCLCGIAEGAELMLPRKIPMRVEPKSYFGKQ